MRTVQKPPVRSGFQWGSKLVLVGVIAGLLIGFGSQNAYKRREYADPDDELYGRIQNESAYTV